MASCLTVVNGGGGARAYDGAGKGPDSMSTVQANGIKAEMAAGIAAAATARHAVRPLAADLGPARGLLGLAVGSLLLAGCCSLVLIVGRLPGVAERLGDPLFFKRGLVLHVDLALVVWFFAYAAGLFCLLPGDRGGRAATRAGACLAAAGVLAMILGTCVPGAQPVLANYVPVIDHPLYLGGVLLFFAGLLPCLVNERLLLRTPEAGFPVGAAPAEGAPARLTPDVTAALKTAALAYLVAVTTFLAAWAATPPALEPRAWYELVFWGGGHVLQVANVAAMLAVWLLLLGSRLGEPVLRPGAARGLFGLLLAPHLAAPLLTAEGTVGPLYRLGFTRLMQFGIAPVVLGVLGACLARLHAARRAGRLGWRDLGDVRVGGFAASAALTLTGFALGAGIRGSNTMIPAHYHASIGAVTAAFMAATWLLLPRLGCPLPGGRLGRALPWQPALFGFGQVVFAAGFALGGLHGLGRKAYAAEQQLRTAGEAAGLLVMALGGLLAVAGGLLYLALVVQAVRVRAAARRRASLKPIQPSLP